MPGIRAKNLEIRRLSHEPVREGDLIAPEPPRLGDHGRVGYGAVEVTVGVVLGAKQPRRLLPAIFSRNQRRSTSAMWRTSLSRDKVEGSTDKPARRR